MDYPYTSENRLETPHAYMYAPFKGRTFFDAYFSDRQKVLAQYWDEACDTSMLRSGVRAIALLGIEASPPLSEETLKAFSPAHEVSTFNLLKTILAMQANGDCGDGIKFWLDRLVQRYEVTKKLYASYSSGFRKGGGPADCLILYWMLAMALYLHFEDTGGLKYLSTGLKVTDLLCSLPVRSVAKELPRCSMALLLRAEIRMLEGLLGKEVDAGAC